MPLFNWGHFTLHSGADSSFLIDCRALTAADWEAAALLAVSRLPAFGAVEGVPEGGLPFAAALQRSVTTGPLLIADDVLTTGQSMIQHAGDRAALGVVLFARSPVMPSWVTPLFILYGLPKIP